VRRDLAAGEAASILLTACTQCHHLIQPQPRGEVGKEIDVRAIAGAQPRHRSAVIWRHRINTPGWLPWLTALAMLLLLVALFGFNQVFRWGTNPPAAAQVVAIVLPLPKPPTAPPREVSGYKTPSALNPMKALIASIGTARQQRPVSSRHVVAADPNMPRTLSWTKLVAKLPLGRSGNLDPVGSAAATTQRAVSAKSAIATPMGIENPPRLPLASRADLEAQAIVHPSQRHTAGLNNCYCTIVHVAHFYVAP
jgi:hypothetical protein